MKIADMVLLNGKLYSISRDDSIQRGTAVAVCKDKIEAIGTDNEIKKYIGSGTEIIDCEGNTILPGLCDGHTHPGYAMNYIDTCDLFNIFPGDEETCDDIINRYKEKVAAYIEQNPDHEIIRGAGWNLSFFNGARGQDRLPNRHDLDEVCSDKPIVLYSFCGHKIWVNTKAIELSGIDASTEFPSTGKVVLEADGYPAGIFRELSAINLIKDNLPGFDFTVEQYKDTIRYFQNEFAKVYGITLIHDAMHTDNARQAYKEMARDGELTMRVQGAYNLEKSTAEKQFNEAVKRKGNDKVGDLFDINIIKMFMDGEFCMCEPYERAITETLGLPSDYSSYTLWTEEEAKKYMTMAMKEGFQVHVHAMGDRGIKQTIDCLEYAQKQVPGQSRNIIAHLMALRDVDIKRMGELKIICSCQPRWMVHDTDVEDEYTKHFGARRALKFFPNKQFLDAGCVVAYGTDYPVTPPPNPYHELQCAMTRSVFKDAPDYERFKGKILGPPEDPTKDCVTLKDAIKALSLNGAYQHYLEDLTGSIEVGKSAEMVVIDSDIEKVPVDELYNIKVRKTIFKGQVVYEG